MKKRIITPLLAISLIALFCACEKKELGIDDQSNPCEKKWLNAQNGSPKFENGSLLFSTIGSPASNIRNGILAQSEDYFAFDSTEGEIFAESDFVIQIRFSKFTGTNAAFCAHLKETDGRGDFKALNVGIITYPQLSLGISRDYMDFNYFSMGGIAFPNSHRLPTSGKSGILRIARTGSLLTVTASNDTEVMTRTYTSTGKMFSFMLALSYIGNTNNASVSIDDFYTSNTGYLKSDNFDCFSLKN
jgi:hypothetical protein